VATDITGPSLGDLMRIDVEERRREEAAEAAWRVETEAIPEAADRENDGDAGAPDDETAAP
jgi:hypothetical protein